MLRAATGPLTACLLLALTRGLPAGDPPAKTPVPPAAARAKAEALIRKELFEAEYTRAAKDPAAAAALARALLVEGRDTADDPAGRYVLFTEARDLAARAGDVPTALQAVDELALAFAFSPAEVFKMRSGALAAASEATATPDAYQSVIDAALLLLEEAVNADDYDSAGALVKTAEAAARKLRVVATVRAVQKRAQEVDRLRQEYAAVKPSADRLAKDPRDARASLVMGRYHALTKGNWERGLALLAQSDDAALRELAKKDLAQPTGGAAQFQVGDGWLKAAAGEKGEARHQMLARAYSWLQQATATLDERGRAEAEARMKAIVAELPAELRPGEIAAEVRRFDGHAGPVFGVAFSPDGRKLVSGGSDGVVRLWDLKSGKEARRLDGHRGPVWAVAYAPDGRQVLSGGFDKTVRIWDPFSGREARELAGHEDYVRGVTFSRDGRQVLSCGDDRTARLWDAASGKLLHTFQGHDHFVWGVALSRDGKRALTASLDKTARLWDTATGSELLKLAGHGDTVLAVAFSPDGRRALTGSTDKTLRLWDLDTGKTLRIFAGHKGYVQGVAFSPDGRRALSTGRDGTLRLWDVESGEEVRRLEGHGDQVWSVAFAPDGRTAASCGHDGSVRLWGGSR